MLVGIIAGVLFPIIYYGAQGFSQHVARKELVSRSRLALERITREIRESVPNTIRISSTIQPGDTIEFGRAVYFSHFSNITGGSSPYPLTDDTGMTPPSTPFVVIYNVSPTDFYAYPASSSTFSVAGVAGNQVFITAASKPHSPTKRYQMSIGPITFSRNASNQLIRYAGYNPGQSHVTSATEQDILIDHVTMIQFTYVPGTLTNTAMITILMQVQSGGETLDFHQEVHVRNVP